ncbi:DUF5687 family protein [Rubrivirga sp.]|uniref:DUF5687 family protein n=1 Tax=Rubrivirga sp. TaxID=1885344 RepID=UPI003C70C51C
MVASLVRLQALAFWRAPYLGGRVALAAVKGAGVAYALGSAAILGFVLPDLLSVVAPTWSALEVVETWMLPALGAIAVGRQVFQEVPTRGATAFLALPVSRERIAWGVLVRSIPSPFTVVPLAFAIPFAARTVRFEAGAGAAWLFLAAILVVVVTSHALLVIWKTRLGAQPVRTVLLAAAAVAVVVALEVGTDGALGALRAGGLEVVAVLGVLAGVSLGVAYRALVAALYLDGAGMRKASRLGGDIGFERAGVRAFLDLDWQLVTRATFPRGTVANAAAASVALTIGALLFAERLFGTGTPTDMVLVFSTGTVAGSVGQYAVPFASGFYDRLLTLPGAVPAFARAKTLGIVAGTVALGAVQAIVVLVLEAESVWLIGVSVLYSLGVLAPAALWGSTLGPKPLDVSDKMMWTNTQSFGAQAVVASTAVVAGSLIALAGTEHGASAAGALGLVGILLSPVWLRAFAARIQRRRHAVALRFRSAL